MDKREWRMGSVCWACGKRIGLAYVCTEGTTNLNTVEDCPHDMVLMGFNCVFVCDQCAATLAPGKVLHPGRP